MTRNAKDTEKSKSPSAAKTTVKDLRVRKADADKVKGGAVMGWEKPPLR